MGSKASTKALSKAVPNLTKPRRILHHQPKTYKNSFFVYFVSGNKIYQLQNIQKKRIICRELKKGRLENIQKVQKPIFFVLFVSGSKIYQLQKIQKFMDYLPRNEKKWKMDSIQ